MVQQCLKSLWFSAEGWSGLCTSTIGRSNAASVWAVFAAPCSKSCDPLPCLAQRRKGPCLCLSLWRKAVFVWAHLNATRQGHAARSSQLAAHSRAAVQTSPPSPSYTPPPPVPQSFTPLPSHHTRSLGAHANTTLVTNLDSLLQLNMGNGASSDPPSPKFAPCPPCPERQRSLEDSAPETRQRRTRHPAGSAP